MVWGGGTRWVYLKTQQVSSEQCYGSMDVEDVVTTLEREVVLVRN